MENKIINIGKYVEQMVLWMTENLSVLFNLVKNIGNNSIEGLENYFISTPFYVFILFFVILAWFNVGRGFGIFTLLGLLLIYYMGFWVDAMETLSLVIVSTIIALIHAIPLGILLAKSKTADKIIRPILDLMQTMPAFVYLIPAVLFFSIGKLPGAFATVIFAMPPAVRFTALGIKQVPTELEESARAFGCTPWQMLYKVELPVAKDTIFAGINQTIMMALSMVVVAGMIAAGGLGERVLEGINNLDIALGFESGLAVVILAIILDRITQALGKKTKIKTRLQKKIEKISLLIVVVLSIIFVARVAYKQTHTKQNKTIAIAYVDGWDEGVAMSKLIEQVLKNKDYNVEMKSAAIDLVFASLSNGDTDVFMDAWLPVTHGNKIEKFKENIELIGVNFETAKIGLAVPKYVTINTIDELNDNSERFSNRIVGIEKGAGISIKTDIAVENYALKLKHLNSSSVAMLSELHKAISNEEWIVVTSWQPHWMFGRWDLKFLEDKKGIYGTTEQIYTYARKGFSNDNPEVARILSNFHLDKQQMASLLLKYNNAENKTEAIKQWMEENKALINSFN